jgi:hypothetical protein
MGVMQFRLSISTNCREYFRSSWWVVVNNPFENVSVDLYVPPPSMSRFMIAPDCFWLLLPVSKGCNP